MKPRLNHGSVIPLLMATSIAACGGMVDDSGSDQESAAQSSNATTILNPIGGSNNQDQINRALRKGGVVHLNAGTYVIDDTITMTSRSTLTGARGAVIKLASAADWPKNRAMIEGHSVSNVRITGFEIDGNASNNTTSNGASTVCGKYFYTMIYFTDSKSIEVDHMYLHDNWNDIFKFSGSSNVRFHDSTVRREGHDVVYAIHSSDVSVFNNSIKIACNSGVRPDGTKPIYVYDNDITRDGGGYAGIEIQGASEVWECRNKIYGTKGPAIANLSGAPVHTTGCPSASVPAFPPAD